MQIGVYKGGETVDDLISREKAIEAIDKIFPADPMRNDYTQGITCGAALATEYIKQLPSAQPEPQKRGKGDVMVSDRELQVWQNGKALIIQSRYCDDPNFTLDQEKALHEIARSFLIVNRKRESDKRRKDRAKRKQEGE